MNAETKNCQSCKNEFRIEAEDFDFYQKTEIPPPTRCPNCRYKRRLLDRNEWSLYRRKCDATGEFIVSIYREGAPFPVYKQEYWRSDKWDPLSYGRDFDFSRSFFEQYEELRRIVPHLALVNSNSVNSEYSNQSENNKDCYMVSATGGSEKCMYGNWFQPGSFFSADCYMIEKSEYCYECINCGRCSNCVYCQDCFDCVSVHFSIDCRGCANCFGCVGLRNKQYCWFNEQIERSEYEKRLKNFDWNRESISEARQKARELSRRSPRKYYHGAKAIDSTGDYMENVAQARSVFNCRENKETGYLQDSWIMEDCLDMTEILDAKRSYEIQGAYKIYDCIALRSCWVASHSYYCDMCFSIQDCFGCFGLRSKQYCILNKQYPKEKYLELKEQVLEHMKKAGEWGEYFPAEVSPFAYNESVAYDFFPLSKEEVLKQGFAWHDRDNREYKISLRASDLPHRISETKDSIVNETIGCISRETEEGKRKYPECATAFRMIPLELQLYRKLNIPVPQKCFPCRRRDRFSLRNPRRLLDRMCECAGKAAEKNDYQNQSEHFHKGGHCPNEIKTAYTPDRPEIVYCEQCYRAEIV